MDGGNGTGRRYAASAVCAASALVIGGPGLALAIWGVIPLPEQFAAGERLAAGLLPVLLATGFIAAAVGLVRRSSWALGVATVLGLLQLPTVVRALAGAEGIVHLALVAAVAPLPVLAGALAAPDLDVRRLRSVAEPAWWLPAGAGAVLLAGVMRSHLWADVDPDGLLERVVALPPVVGRMDLALLVLVGLTYVAAVAVAAHTPPGLAAGAALAIAIHGTGQLAELVEAASSPWLVATVWPLVGVAGGALLVAWARRSYAAADGWIEVEQWAHVRGAYERVAQ